MIFFGSFRGVSGTKENTQAQLDPRVCPNVSMHPLTRPRGELGTFFFFFSFLGTLRYIQHVSVSSNTRVDREKVPECKALTLKRKVVAVVECVAQHPCVSEWVLGAALRHVSYEAACCPLGTPTRYQGNRSSGKRA